MLITSALVLTVGTASAYAATYVPQVSPTFPSLAVPTDVITSYNYGPYDTSPTLSTEKLSGFPPVGSIPSLSSAEVEAAFNSIDWDKVPKAPIRKLKSNGDWDFSNNKNDPFCWWSDTNCMKPKVSYLPDDIYTCPNNGDWGLTYDDGPFIKVTGRYASLQNPYAEPRLYNFLAETNQKATLFYAGSNVVQYPAAAKRALENGHQICVHTWSHHPMTTLSNKQVVSELYWGLKAIKAATGVTPKCWRPPQGDVDDRVRSIAYQLGMHTILWDLDTNDWDIPNADNGGNTPAKTVDKSFQTWINNYKTGKDKSGHIVLEHELNSATVNISMAWMPEIQKVFNVLPALACNGITQPYWEEDFVYPTTNIRPGSSTKTTTTSGSTRTSTSTTTTTTTATSTPIATCIAGSSGKKNGDGYKNYCCKTSDDCLDTCIKGKCNGPVNTNIPGDAVATQKTTTQTTTKSISTTTATTKSTSPTSTSCIAGVAGKKKGNGKTGYCCTTSDDCLETCRSGKCGL
ncbi:hypothetical protein BD560DRAFT_376510 [Blakeslea trispora]|nr:hypothetical protein BD560DRAFT_376510 [Blakeslea trispora]